MKMSHKPVFSNLLIRVPNWLGDTLMATPAVSAAREMFPKARISILAKPARSVFWENFPGVSRVLTLDRGAVGFWKCAAEIRKNKFDAALILPSSFSSAFLVFVAGVPERIGWSGEGRDFLLTSPVENPKPRQKHLVWEYMELLRKGFGKRVPPHPIRLLSPVALESKSQTLALFKKEGVQEAKGLLALAPGATYGPAKRWPLPYWSQLISKLLQERKESILILGGPEETGYLEPLVKDYSEKNPRVHLLAGKTPAPVLAAVLSKSKILVTNDTGPMHVAAGVGTPVLALFGSTSPLWTRPFGEGHEVIYKGLECSPCFQKTCPIGYKCLHAISVEEVFRSAQSALRSRRKVSAEKIPAR